MAFNRAAAKQAGYSDMEIDSYLESQENQANIQQPSALGNIGKLLGGVAKFVAPKTSQLVSESFSSKEKAKELSPNLVNMVSPGTMLFRNDALGGATREIGSMMALSKLLPWLTKTKIGGGVAGKSTKAAAKATSGGTKVAWDEIENAIKTNVEKKLGATTQIKRKTWDILTEKLPASLSPDPTLDPTQLLDWRRQIQARGGKNFLQRLFTGTSVPEKVEGVARSTISNILHEYVPATKIPDLLYRMYSGPLGSPFQAVPKIGAGILGLGSLPSALRSLGVGGGSNYGSGQ